MFNQQALSTHPKVTLYVEAYTPLVAEWFGLLQTSLALQKLRESAPDHELIDNLHRLDSVFRDLVDELLDRPSEVRDHAIAVVSRHRDAVVWEDQMVPAPDAGVAELTASLRHKFKRNISLAMLEALICLESALAYGRDVLGLRGDELADTLRRSTAMLASLSVLHDEQEVVRMRYLTGNPKEIQHPSVRITDVIDGTFRIGPDKFRVVGPPDQQRIRFGSVPPGGPVPDSPTMKCPAHRLTNEAGRPRNDDFWNVLVDIYQLSGRFE